MPHQRKMEVEKKIEDSDVLWDVRNIILQREDAVDSDDASFLQRFVRTSDLLLWWHPWKDNAYVADVFFHFQA